tara:strand:- start:49648 stop:50490 length:843 start_codon:yes stop_codon:yes gene_type:complete
LKTQTLKKDVLPVVKEVATLAGEKLLRYSKKIHKLEVTSKDAEGMVSEADIKTEKFIEKKLKKLLPKASFLGEESAFLNIKDKSKAYREFQKIEWSWIVDPLDGTHNFLSGLDYYGVCIALTHFGRPVLGVVYRPGTGELYYAIKNGGAFKEDLQKNKRTKLSKESNTKKLKDSMVVTGFSLEKGIENPGEFKALQRVMREVRGLRRFGSAALDMCLVSEGIFDCYWEKGLSPWDVAASGIICEEAKVHVTDYTGEVFHPFQNSVFCARKPLYKKIINLI